MSDTVTPGKVWTWTAGANPNGPVAVVHGGASAERAVSLRSGTAVAGALAAGGFPVVIIDADARLVSQLLAIRPRCVVPMLHGPFGEDGCLQGILEWHGIPYFGSGVAASAMGMDKPLTKRLLKAEGLPVADGVVVSPNDPTSAWNVARIPFAWAGRGIVVKPAADGSSVGVRLLGTRGEAFGDDDLRAAIDAARPHGGAVLIELFIPGAELSVAVFDEGPGKVRALGVVEIRPKSGFYDLANKYTSGATEYLVPAPIGEEATQRAMDLAVRAHLALGCRGLTRTDIRYSPPTSEGQPGDMVILEVNTAPGMTETSLVPKLAALAGIDFATLCRRMVELATLDHPRTAPSENTI